MNDLQVVSGLSNSPVAASSFPFLKNRKRAMHADVKHIMLLEQIDEFRQPTIELDYMVNDEIVAGVGHRADASVKSFEEPWSHRAYPIGSISPVPTRQEASFDKLVRRHMPKRLWHLDLKLLGDCSFACARCTVKEDDSAH